MKDDCNICGRALASHRDGLACPQWQCTQCGHIGTVGRCCGVHTRIPLNDAAKREADSAPTVAERDLAAAKALLAECQNLLQRMRHDFIPSRFLEEFRVLLAKLEAMK